MDGGRERSVLAEAVDRGDLDELTRLVDALAERREWEALLELRDRARRALERGRQLWPTASLVEYRLALDAPAAVAARVLVDGAGHLSLGPLSEVAAQHHTWAELAPHVAPGPVGALVAHERAVRGEGIDGEVVPRVLDAPLALAAWEPRYVLARYRTDRAEFPSPPVPRRFPSLHAAGRTLPPDDVTDALRELVRPWTVGSNATVRVVAVEGDGPRAIAALGPLDPSAAEVDAAEALGWMAWAAAGSGAHGRRRGAAVGRDAAWVAASTIAGFAPGEVAPSDELGPALAELRWFLWEAGTGPAGGHRLRLAVADPSEGLAWALDAVDR